MAKKQAEAKAAKLGKAETTSVKEGPEPKEEDKALGAMERCQAVLSVWTERRKPAEVCREMKVPYALLSQWQDRALEGMLQALQPRMNLAKGAALPPRLQRILEKRSSPRATPKSLTERLSRRLSSLAPAERPVEKEKPAQAAFVATGNPEN